MTLNIKDLKEQTKPKKQYTNKIQTNKTITRDQLNKRQT